MTFYFYGLIPVEPVESLCYQFENYIGAQQTSALKSCVANDLRHHVRPAVWTPQQAHILPSVGPERQGSRPEDRKVLRKTEGTWPEGGKVSAGSGVTVGHRELYNNSSVVFKNARMHPTTLCAN